MASFDFLRSRKCMYVSSLLTMAVFTAGCSSGSSTPQSISISVIPAAASVQVAGTQTFTAAVANTSNKAVTWKVNGVVGGDATHGNISSTGTYSAPAAV